MELNHPPAIQRTIRILYTARMSGFDLHLTAEDRAYVAWVLQVDALLRALADGWWGEINPDLRVLFVDGDDAPPITLLNSMFPGLRARRPPPLRQSAQAVGLEDVELSALSRVRRAAHRTSVFRAATQIAREIRSNARRRRALQRELDRLGPELEVRGGRSVFDETERLRELVGSAYVGADAWIRGAVQGLRAYNELVHAGFAFLLGYAEDLDSQAPVVVEGEHPVSVEMSLRAFDVHLTFSQPNSLVTGATFTIGDGGPLDGLYWQTGTGFQAAGDLTILDLMGSRISDREIAP